MLSLIHITRRILLTIRPTVVHADIKTRLGWLGERLLSLFALSHARYSGREVGVRLAFRFDATGACASIRLVDCTLCTT